MFVVSEEERAAIRQAFEAGGEWAAVTELRRYFPLQRNEDALAAVRAIMQWRSKRPLQVRGHKPEDAGSKQTSASIGPVDTGHDNNSVFETTGRNATLLDRKDWTPATFEAVAAEHGGTGAVITIALDGEVCGAFGIDQRAAADHVMVWVVTHLPTGQRLPREFLTRAAAIACVIRLEGLDCWSMVDAAAMQRHPDTVVAQRVLIEAPGSREG